MPAEPFAHPDQPYQRVGPFAGLLGWVLGTALQLQQEALWPIAGYAPMLLVGVGWCMAHRRLYAWPVWQRQVAWLLALALLAFAVTGLRCVAFEMRGLHTELEGRDVQVTGVVADMPQRNEAGLRFTLDIEASELDGAVVDLPPRIDVGWYTTGVSTTGDTVALQRQPGDVRAGERWRMTLRLKAPHGSRNPFGFDYELWLWERGVQATGYVRGGAADPAPQRMAQTWAHPVALLRQTVRERIATHVEQRQFAGLIAALVVGDQAAIDRADWDVFRATGVAHLVSISGLHITMFAWGAAWIVGWLWRRSVSLCQWLPAPNAALVGGLVLALAYSVFSGWGIPAQRTCLMLAIVTLLRLSGARWPWPQTWMLACAAVVGSDPWALQQAGFWLSFVAVGVLFATDAGASQVQDAGWVQGSASRLRTMLREQWVVTVALAPLTLFLFGQLSVVGMVANSFAIPWVTLVLTPMAMLGVAVPSLWDVAAGAIAVLMAVLQWLAAWPWATLALPTAPWWFAAAGVVGGVLLLAQLPWHVRFLGLPLLLPVLFWQAVAPAPGAFELLAADIGQGNAVLVRTANHALLYDAGPRYSLESDAGHRVLVPLLQALQVHLDTVVISHRDTDHIGGAPAVLTMQPQVRLLSSIAADDKLQTLHPAERCLAGQHWEWDGVQFDILHPQRDDYDSPQKPNALSCVLRIQSADMPQPVVALLVGDIEKPQEDALVAAHAPLQADLLLVPHHGSKTSSSEAFLDAVQPREAWVQSGYRNRYGHPAALVMQRYDERHIVVHDSPHCGAMRWLSTDKSQVHCLRSENVHYWSHHVP
jgi:competence protein ComEC